MSMAIDNLRFRIWFIDKLCPNATIEEVRQMATDFCNEIYDDYSEVIEPDERINNPDGREPTHLKFKLQNGEVLNVFEQYIEVKSTTSSWYEGQIEHCIAKYNKLTAVDQRFNYEGPPKRYIYICGKHVLKFFVDFDESKCDEYITRQEPELEGISIGIGMNHSEWMYDNPEWDFKKIVLDRIEPYIINAELMA